MVSKYFAVVCGVNPGIYEDWPTTQKMVNGFPGAIFKSFRTKHEAEEFMKASTCVKATSILPHTIPLVNKTIIYTDGSFNQGLCGFGVVIITSDGSKIIAYGKVPDTVFTNGPTNNVAELYALYVGLSLVQGDVVIYTDSQYSIGALTTYINGWIKSGWKGVANRNLIEGTYSLMQGRDVKLHYVPAHSGCELNEECDRLADQGRLVNESLIVLKDNIRII